MEFLNKNKNTEDLELLGKICFDTFSIELNDKPHSDEFCGIYFEGRGRNINCIEDFAALHSFKAFSKYNYPFLIFSPNNAGVAEISQRYKNSRICHIEIPECDTHNKYSNFVTKEFWNFLPKQFERLLFMHPDGFLIKNGWEDFVQKNNLAYCGAAWCHSPSVGVLNPHNNDWENFSFPRIYCGNGGFSYRSRFCCETISNIFSKFTLRENGREDNREPQEDLFYSYFINGTNVGKVANIKQCMQFSLDPITLEEYNKKISFGFHYPKRVNEFQKYRDYYLSL
jgi:Protein of unknown function (DUF5672)